MRVYKILFLMFVGLIFSVNIFAQDLITTGDFRISLPNEETKIEAGEELDVVWSNASYSARNFYRLKIELCENLDPVLILSENTFNDGQFSKVILSTFSPGKYRVKMTPIEGGAIAYSDEFEIVAPVPIKILQPTSESGWNIGNEQLIIWQDQYPDSMVYIDILKVGEDGKKTFIEKVADGIENHGQLFYTVGDNMMPGKYVLSFRIPPVNSIKYSQEFVVEE